jgi:hypothetical protein
MKAYITLIAKALKITEEEATKVQNFMDENWMIDRWSSATKAEINRAARLAYVTMQGSL